MLAEQHSFGSSLFLTFTSNPTVNSRPMFWFGFFFAESWVQQCVGYIIGQNTGLKGPLRDIQ